MWYKQGVTGDLQQIARKALGNVAKMYGHYGYDLYVTALRDGNHSFGSLHYDGLAFDIRKAEKITLELMRGACGPGFDIVDEGTHYHVEFDPK